MKNQLNRIARLEQQAAIDLDFSKMSDEELRTIIGDCAEFFATLSLEQLQTLADGQPIFLTEAKEALAPKHGLLHGISDTGAHYCPSAPTASPMAL